MPAKRLSASRTRPRVFYGWYIVLVTFVGSVLSGGIGGYAFGLFIKPMSEAMGWSRALISTVFLVRTGFTLPVAMAMGPLLDRNHGARLIMAVGALLGGLGLILAAFTATLWHFYLSLGLLWGIGSLALGSDLVVPTIISKWFIQRRGLAIAIALMGISLGGAVLVPMTAVLMGLLGWRGAWAALGALTIAVMVPMSLWLVRGRPEDMGLLPDGATRSANPGPALVEADLQEETWTLRQASRQRALWLLLFCFTMSNTAFGGLFVHLLPYITDKGYSPATAAAILTILGIVAGLVKPPWGLAGDRFEVRFLLAGCFFIAGASLILLIRIQQGWAIFLFPVLYASGAGGLVTLGNLIWGNYFGRTFLGSIRGMFTPVIFLANGLSPIFSGWMYDHTHSYDLAYWTFTGLMLLGGAAMLFAAPPKKSSRV